MVRTIDWGQDKILESFVPKSDSWIPNLLQEFSDKQTKVRKSHKIGGRWENLYLRVKDVPSVKVPMRYARDLAKRELETSSIILFEAIKQNPDSYPPFWFNIARNGEKTGLHDHARVCNLSAVTYLQACCDSGDLFFRRKGVNDLCIKPEVGKIVIFPPHLKHGVHSNLSSIDRISLAFNLFPFPLIHSEI
jgi:hypothetical protein